MKRLLVLSTVLTLCLSAPSRAENLPLPADAEGWFVRTRAMAGVSHAAGEFSVLPPGATGSEQISADPQAYFGVGAGLGYRWQGWAIPLRAVLDASLNFRHDTDISAEFAGGLLAYENNLRVWDFRVSLLADVLRFRWGTVYVGGGIGAAHLESEVEIEAHPLVEESSEWKASPSVEAGERRHQDDGAGLPGFHRAESGLHHQECAQEVQGYGLLPEFQCRVDTAAPFQQPTRIGE